MKDPFFRARRLREHPTTRSWCRETILSKEMFIYPVFVVPGKKIKEEIPSMPGIFHYSIDTLLPHLKGLIQSGLKSIIVFGVPQKKDSMGKEAYRANGIVQQAIKAVKKSFPELYIISDVCLCQYTSHGHCGIVKNGIIENDPTLELLAKTALSQVNAGADMVAPSDMMDGRISVIRQCLNGAGFTHIPIMSYSAKYSSAFYGPFREAAHSAPQFGNRASYQMDPTNSKEAMREIWADIEEGADIIMVKPALAFLDIIKQADLDFNIPIAAYNVSGEFSMVKAAAEKGWIDEKKVTLEILTGIVRAGARIILSYHTPDVIKWLEE
ncbi:porphobilinogen synthase [Candidatus Riflebacteria bacterium]